jgi:hypothetical protein
MAGSNPTDDSTDREPLVEDEAEGDEEVLPFRYSITAYGKDYPVDGLVKRVRTQAISIPSFQRQYVWKKPQADRFIESLLLGLPIPGIFLAEDPDSDKLLVLDGQQRLRTLQYFYDGKWKRGPFALSNVQERYKGLTYEDLSENDRIRLDDSSLHATIVRQDEPSEDQSSVYFVFERINTGGTPLAPQEIRACLYQGALNDLLAQLNENADWREVIGRPSPRLKDQELILRFFALYYERDRYQRPMKEFLNEYMGRHRSLKRLSAERLTEQFTDTIAVVEAALGPGAFRPKAGTNAAVFDSVMVGLATRLDRGPIKDDDGVAGAYLRLLRNDDYIHAYSRSTADEEQVEQRIDLAISAFAVVK